MLLSLLAPSLELMAGKFRQFDQVFI